MRLGKLLAATAVAAVWAGAATVSHAAIVGVTYSGLATGFDGLGLFGSTVFYANTPFTTYYAFDEDAAGLVGHPIAAAITIGGSTVDLVAGGGNYTISDQATQGVARRDAISVFGASSVVPEYSYLSTTLASDLTPGDRTAAYSATGSYDTNTNQHVWDHFAVGESPQVYFTLRASSVVVTSTPSIPTGHGVGEWGGIPEPATWAMTLVGFFGLGSGLRHRPRTKAENAKV